MSESENTGELVEKSVGMKYCGEDEQLYFEVLEEYLKDNKVDELSGYLKKDDYDNYRIKIHALKSASLSIGASALSEKCKALEMACKDGNKIYVEKNHQAVMEDYKAVLEYIKKMLENK